MNFLGIDPGNQGAMVCLNQYGDIQAIKTFEKNKLSGVFDGHKFSRDFKDIIFNSPEPIVYVEKVHARPKQGVTSMFNFGMGYGMIQGCIIHHGLDLHLVSPHQWQTAIHFESDRHMDPKSRSLAAFEKLYPGIDPRKSSRSRVPHSGIVDALLIAEYARQKHAGGNIN